MQRPLLWRRERDSEPKCAAMVMQAPSVIPAAHSYRRPTVIPRRSGVHTSTPSKQLLRRQGFSLSRGSLRHKSGPCTVVQRPLLWRRERDSNPRSVISRTHDFQSCALDQLSHLSMPTDILYYFFLLLSSLFRKFLIEYRIFVLSDIARRSGARIYTPPLRV